MKKKDMWFLLVILALGFLGIFFLHNRQQTTTVVVVKVDGEVVLEKTLDTKTTWQKVIVTEYGENTLQIENGQVQMIHADCENQVCVNTGAISTVGDTIVCLPHHLVVEIQDTKKEPEVDGVVK